MGIFIKALAAVLTVLILGTVLARQGKEIWLLFLIAACCMVCIAAISFLEPVISFIEQLRSVSNLNGQLTGILLKAVGVGWICQLLSLLCTDGGNAALGKAVQILGACVILWMALPLMTRLLELIEDLMVAV